MKADLHVHSSYSKRPSHWLLKRIGCNESYTSPGDVYEIARSRGMDLVTLTDHNSIEGCLEIAGLPGTFISEEVTTYFPEDGCKIHVAVYNITEAQHEDLQKVRQNIYELTEYLEREEIVHTLAHPLYAVNERLTVEHVEKLLLLFDALEINGDQSRESNLLVKRLAEETTQRTLERLSIKHGIPPRRSGRLRKALTGGSDDHSSLYVAKTYTEVPGARTLEDYLKVMARGAGRVRCLSSTPRIMAHHIYGVAYQYLKERLDPANRRRNDLVVRILDGLLEGKPGRTGPEISRLSMAWHAVKGWGRRKPPTGPMGMLEQEASRFLKEESELVKSLGAMMDQEKTHDVLYEVINRLSNRLLGRFGDHVLDHYLKGNVFDLFHTLGSAGALYCALAPYYVSFGIHGSRRMLENRVSERFFGEAASPGDTAKVANFTDGASYEDPTGPTPMELLTTARKLEKDYTVLTCGQTTDPDEPGVIRFEPVGEYELEGYPGGTLVYPPMLAMLDRCYDAGYTHLMASTPGPMGLAALGIGWILKLPVVAVYQETLPGFTRIMTEDGSIGDLTWRYLTWFYNQADLVVARSRSGVRELASRGVPEDKIRLVDQNVLGVPEAFEETWQSCVEASRRFRQKSMPPRDIRIAGRMGASLSPEDEPTWGRTTASGEFEDLMKMV